MSIVGGYAEDRQEKLSDQSQAGKNFAVKVFAIETNEDELYLLRGAGKVGRVGNGPKIDVLFAERNQNSIEKLERELPLLVRLSRPPSIHQTEWRNR